MRQIISRIQEISIYNLLKPIITKDPEGYAKYVNGHSDKSVYETFIRMYPNSRISVGHVARYRTEVFGKLKHHSLASHTPGRIANLEEITTKLMEWASNRPRDPFKL